MANNRTVALALGTFAETFPTREVTARTVEVWMTVMADVSDEDLGRAVLWLCRNPDQRFFPSSGEVFAALRETRIQRPLLPLPVEPPRERMILKLNPGAPTPLAGIIGKIMRRAASGRATA